MAHTKKKKEVEQSRDFMLDNSLVKSLPDEYVKNPLSFSQICGDFSLSQSNIMIAMVGQLQERINAVLQAPDDQMLLFKPEEMISGDLVVDIPLNQLGVQPQRYSELDAALEALHSMKITYEERDENGIVYKVRNNIIGKSRIPVDEVNSEGARVGYKRGQRRKGSVTISIRRDCVKDLFNLRKGYTEHLKGIVKLCKRSRTPRLYIYLSSWRQKGNFISEFNDLKEFLGVLTYNRDRTKVIDNKYAKFADFKRYVMDPVEQEMRQLANQNKIEFYFTYEPLYKTGRTTGNPERILFTLHSTQKGIDFDLNRRIERLHGTLIASYNLQPEEWDSFAFALDAESEERISSQLYRLSEAIQKNNVAVPHAYVTAYILKELGIEQEVSGQQEDVAPEPALDPLSPDDLTRWNIFCQRAPIEIDESFANIFVTPCHLHAVTPECVTILVPTEFVKEKWLEQADAIARLLHDIFGPRGVNFLVDPNFH